MKLGCSVHIGYLKKEDKVLFYIPSSPAGLRAAKQSETDFIFPRKLEHSQLYGAINNTCF